LPLILLVCFTLLTSCYPLPPAATLGRPTRAESGDQIILVAPDSPYLPANQPNSGDWPTRPLTLIVPFLPGGDTDMYARMFAPRLAEILGQPVYVVNMDGGSGTAGAAWVSFAAPDGDTILFYHTGNLFTNVLTGAAELNYNDFKIACVAAHCDANVLVVHSGLGINSAQEFLARIKTNPGSLNVATTITGFSFKLLRMAEIAGGFRTNAVHVGGGSMMAPSILAGHTEVGYNNIAVFMEYIQSGEMIPLWIAADERNALLPDVPTIREVGIENGHMGRSYFFALPPGIDEYILHTLSEAVRQITDDPAFQQQLFDTVGMTEFFIPYDDASRYLSGMWNQVKDLEQHMRYSQ
jgi:tripartite-type tricarboxylate transporter receptor subunit TctC